MSVAPANGLTPRLMRVEGEFHRVADPWWDDPLDTGYAKERGGRWNPPDEFGVLYLNENLDTARAYLATKFAGAPYGPDDMQDGPVLVTVDIPLEDYVDAIHDEALSGLGLPASYPAVAPGSADVVGHDVCQPIGLALFQAGHLGVYCRSANTATGEGRELAWLDQPGRAVPEELRAQTFQRWW